MPDGDWLSEKLGLQLTERIRDVAFAAGVPVAAAKCRTNMLLVGVDSGAEFLRTLRSKDHSLLFGLWPREVRQLIAATGPVRSWTITAVQNSDGAQAPSSSGGNGYASDASEISRLPVYTSSKLKATTQRAIQTSVVVIDWPQMLGKSPNQIADYAAMRMLAKSKSVEGGRLSGSILTLFDKAATTVPGMMTGADMVYLKTLYGIPADQFSRQQKGELARAIASTVAK